MNGPAIMPWLRKNDRISVLSRASIVRTLEACANGIEEARADASLSRVGFNVDGENPAAGRRSEFPVAHFADDEPDDALPVVSHEEFPLRLPGVAITPVNG
jgi:hypothetical protein